MVEVRMRIGFEALPCSEEFNSLIAELAALFVVLDLGRA
jgi:hypothetical protein